MKTKLIIILHVAAVAAALAQPPAPATPAAAPPVPEGTQVSSNSFRLDLSKKEGVFSGDVRVTEKQFQLTAEELVVYFAGDNTVERFVARGSVKIEQGTDKSSTCREAEYLVAEKRLRLTGEPVVMQQGNKVTGTVITIFPDTNRLEVDGRSKVQFFLK